MGCDGLTDSVPLALVSYQECAARPPRICATPTWIVAVPKSVRRVAVPCIVPVSVAKRQPAQVRIGQTEGGTCGAGPQCLGAAGASCAG